MLTITTYSQTIAIICFLHSLTDCNQAFLTTHWTLDISFFTRTNSIVFRSMLVIFSPKLSDFREQIDERVGFVSFTACPTVDDVANTILIFRPCITNISQHRSSADRTIRPDFRTTRRPKIFRSFTLVQIVVPVTFDIRNCICELYPLTGFCWMTLLAYWQRVSPITIFGEKPIHVAKHFCSTFRTIEVILLF